MNPRKYSSEHGVDLKTFREEILPAGRPVVLKGLVRTGRRCAPDANHRGTRAIPSAASIAANKSNIIEGPPAITAAFSIATT